MFIVFDTNVHTNDSVKWARKGICRELATRSAKVDFFNLPRRLWRKRKSTTCWPPWGPARGLALFDGYLWCHACDVVASSSVSGDGRMECFVSPTRGEQAVTQIQLTNYRATVSPTSNWTTASSQRASSRDQEGTADGVKFCVHHPGVARFSDYELADRADGCSRSHFSRTSAITPRTLDSQSLSVTAGGTVHLYPYRLAPRRW